MTKQDETIQEEPVQDKTSKAWNEFTRENKVNKTVIDNEGNQAYIVGFKGLDKRTTQQGEEYIKAVFIVQFPSKNQYDFEMSENGARTLTNEFIKKDVEIKGGDDFVGARILMTPKEKGQFKWIEVALLDLPDDKSE